MCICGTFKVYRQILLCKGWQKVYTLEKCNPEQQALVAEGFDVLVFVPSMDEEDGLVTCGNAVLGGSTLKLDKPVIRIVGI